MKKEQTPGEGTRPTVPKAVSAYMAAIGSKGGGRHTEAQKAAARAAGLAPCRPGRKRGRPPGKKENK